jgi:hypothetical protein
LRWAAHLQARGDRRLHVLQADIAQAHLGEARGVAAAGAVRRAGRHRATARQSQALGECGGNGHAGGTRIQEEYHGFAVNRARRDVVAHAVAPQFHLAHARFTDRGIEVAIRVVLPVEEVAEVQRQQRHGADPRQYLHDPAHAALLALFAAHGCKAVRVMGGIVAVCAPIRMCTAPHGALERICCR